MTYSTYNINTPSPYLVLHKVDKIPNILSIGQSNPNSNDSVETDIKILTAHKCNGETLITELSTENLDPFLIPGSFLASKFGSLPKKDAIKIGNLTKDAVALLKKHMTSISVPVVISADSLDTETFTSLKEVVFKQSTLVVVSITKAQKLLNLSNNIKTVEDIFSVVNQFSNEASASNVLITNCKLTESNSFDVLFTSDNQDFTTFKAHVNVRDCNGMISTAITANLAHEFSLKEAIYGALEYVQSSVTVNNNGNTAPNFMYAIESPLKHMIADECFTAHEIVPIPKTLKAGPMVENFYAYLIQHPLVKPYWDTYIHHDFVRQIADGTLPLKKFQFFIEQDYSYLVDYGRVHCIAGAKSPDLEDMEKELVIVGRVREEMSQHEKRLKEEFGVKDDSYFKNIKRGPALNNYSRYFNQVAKRGNWEELVMALTPCMMGYGESAKAFKGKVTAPKGGMYSEWIDIYSCENYDNGMDIGMSLLNHVARTYPVDQIEKLIRIYGEVCDLETKFWDAALAYE